MDTDQIFQNSRARFEHAAAKKLLREKYQAKMLFAYRSGMWQAGPDLLAVLQSLRGRDQAVLLDLYENPISVDVAELSALVIERWQEQMQAWLHEHEHIKSQR